MFYSTFHLEYLSVLSRFCLLSTYKYLKKLWMIRNKVLLDRHCSFNNLLCGITSYDWRRVWIFKDTSSLDLKYFFRQNIHYLQINLYRIFKAHLSRNTEIALKEQNRSTEGCSKLKRSIDLTSSGKNGLNMRTNASPKWDRTRCPEE